jgi:predicted aspartyl protease
MKIENRGGLLFTSLKITYKGKTKAVTNIVIDTGASHSLISQDSVNDIGIKVEMEDEIITSYGIGGKEHAFTKYIDKIDVAGYSLTNFQLDISGSLYEDINGLLGLDILMEAGFIIDLKRMEIYR